jgi:DNA-binding NarL/FixJ family response regulator
MNKVKSVRIVIADDHPVVRMGVRNLLQSQPDMEVVGEASDGEEALKLIAQLRPDVLLLDLSMPRVPGLDTLRELTDSASYLRTILLTSEIERRQVLEALQLGARGIVLKNAVLEDLLASIRSVLQGHYWLRGGEVTNLVSVLKELMAEDVAKPRNTFGLTPRELDVVRNVVQGGTNRDIATALGISEETVKRHLTNAFDKTGVSNRLELALFAMHHQLVAPEGA